MPQIIETIEEVIANDFQHDGIWIVFNTVYNKVAALELDPQEIPELNNSASGNMKWWLNREYTDDVARLAFLEFMSKECPEVKLVEVFDHVPIGFLQWPYLGSIAIDVKKGDNAYGKLVEKYGDPYAEIPPELNNVLWVMHLEDAQAICKKRDEDFF